MTETDDTTTASAARTAARASTAAGTPSPVGDTSSLPEPDPAHLDTTRHPSAGATQHPPGSARSAATAPHQVGADPPNEPRGRRRRPAQPPPEHLALLRIDIEALWRGHVQGDEICEITGLGSFPVSAARRLLGDAVIKLIITKGNAVAHVTSLTRGPTQSMRYALLWTNPTCTAQGCTRTILEHDHPYGAEYKDTHHTRLDEIDPLCHSHHALHTHRGWALTPGTSKRPMVPPTDPRHPANAARAGPGDDRARPGATSDRTSPVPAGATRQGWQRAGPPAARQPAATADPDLQPDLFDSPAA